MLSHYDIDKPAREENKDTGLHSFFNQPNTFMVLPLNYCYLIKVLLLFSTSLDLAHTSHNFFSTGHLLTLNPHVCLANVICLISTLLGLRGVVHIHLCCPLNVMAVNHFKVFISMVFCFGSIV